jgi:hypothetical protein
MLPQMLVTQGTQVYVRREDRKEIKSIFLEALP